MQPPMQQHTVIVDIATAASGIATWNLFTGYVTPIVSFIVLIMAGVVYCIQIANNPAWKNMLKRRYTRKLARLRRKHRKPRF